MSIKIKRHLQSRYPAEAALFASLATVPKITRRDVNLPEGLVRVIAGQMLSAKAAATIYGRLQDASIKKKLAGSWMLGPKTLRTCGLSGNKVAAVRKLASLVKDNPKALDHWYDLDATTLHAEVSSMHGIGPWSASIISMFYVGHEDIFPTGDNSLNRALKILNNQLARRKSHQMFQPELAEPYRSYLALYLWKALDTGALVD